MMMMFCTYGASSAFTPRRPLVTTGSTRKARASFLAKSSSNSWNEEHLIHGASEIHEETEEELRESEITAAFDAHDCSDPGMEAAMEMRALMMAQDIAHQLKEKALKQQQEDVVTESIKNKMENWNEEHLIHGAHEIHEETDAEVREAEDAAAIDAHDCSDPGMEAAMEERAVMLAREFAQKMKEQAARKNKVSSKQDDDDDDDGGKK
jgi:hypothetical protein